MNHTSDPHLAPEVPMPLPLSHPEPDEVVLVAGPDPTDPSRWLYIVERAGDGPGDAEVLESGDWADLGGDLSLLEQVPYALRLPVPVVRAGLSWCDADGILLTTSRGAGVRLSWRLPARNEDEGQAEDYSGL